MQVRLHKDFGFIETVSHWVCNLIYYFKNFWKIYLGKCPINWKIHYLNRCVNHLQTWPECGYNWNGPLFHLGPWLFWFPRGLGPEKFGLQVIWRIAQMRSGTISVIAQNVSRKAADFSFQSKSHDFMIIILLKIWADSRHSYTYCFFLTEEQVTSDIKVSVM